MVNNGCVKNILSPSVDPIWGDYNPASVSVREAQCGKFPFNRAMHGFTCLEHFKEQASLMPDKPRHPRKPYIKQPEMLLSDTAYVDRIVRLEREGIARLRAEDQVRTLTFGKYDPLRLQIVAQVRA